MSANPFSRKGVESAGVQNSGELRRILALPRRTWTDEDAQRLAVEMSAKLRRPGGTQTLRPIQAVALFELWKQGSLFGPVGTGMGKCVSGDTEIYDLEKGRVTAGSMTSGKVPAMTEKTRSIVGASAVAAPSGVKACVELVLDEGSRVVLSTDHPVFTQRGWVQASAISVEDLVATPRRLPLPEKVLEISEDEVKMAAYLLSDGSVSQNSTVFTNMTPCVLVEVRRLAERLCDPSKNLSPVWQEKTGSVDLPRRTGLATDIRLHGIGWFRRKWGINGLSKEKRLPAAFWCLSNEAVSVFLNRFWSCDGWITKSEVGVSLASERMIDDLRFLLLRIGVHTRKISRSVKLNGKVFQAWRILVTAQSVGRFFEAVGLIFGKEEASKRELDRWQASSRNTNVDIVPVRRPERHLMCDELGWPRKGTAGPKGKRSELKEFLNGHAKTYASRERFATACRKFGYSGSLAWLASSDLFWCRVESVSNVGRRPVFDLSVPGYGCFVGNNIVLHNTLILLLAPLVIGARKPLLLVPAKLVEKTLVERDEYAKHWPIPVHTQIISHNTLSVASRKGFLEEGRYDFIGVDECHALRNPGVSRTKSFSHFLKSHHPRLCLLTGSMSKNSIKDFAHFLKWTLGERAPVPLTFGELQEWAEALDQNKSDRDRTRPIGYLRQLMNYEESTLADEATGARRAFRRRVVESIGVIATSENIVGSSLTLEARDHAVDPEVDAAFRNLRIKWELPDGQPSNDSLAVYRKGRELSLGFFLKWDPVAPKEWMARRKEWAKQCREVLKTNRLRLDSELMVVNALDADPSYQLEAWVALQAWREIEPAFKPNKVAVWLSDASIDYCARWAHTAPGIVWCEHVAFAERLAKYGNLRYYGAGSGAEAMKHDPRSSFVASSLSLSEGLNLQKWNRNLITSFPSNGVQAEQLMARTHRPGQDSEEVTFDFLVNSFDQFSAFESALANARYQEEITGQQQKLVYADKLVPKYEDVVKRGGIEVHQARWLPAS